MQSVTIPVDGRPIDRTMPAILHGHMNSKDWTDFCNQHDEAAVPSVGSRSCKAFPKIPFVLVFLAAIITIILSVRREFTRDPWSSSFSFGIPIGMFLLFVTFVASIICFGIVASRESEKLISALKRLCEETSNKQSSLTFHFKSETFLNPSSLNDSHRLRTVDKYYIEVFIAETTVDAAPMTSYYDPEIANPSAPICIAATAYVPGLALSSSEASHPAADRLQELEKIKHLLTETEYAQKRDDIIAAV